MSESLGDILRDAIIHQKGRTEMILHVKVVIEHGEHSKIQAIKLVRNALGIGLREAKEFVEEAGNHGFTGTTARMSSASFGKLYALINTYDPRKHGDYTLGLSLSLIKIEQESTQPAYDFV